MSGSHDARCSVHIKTDVGPIDHAWVAGVQAHADADFVAVGPRMFCQRSLCLCCGAGGVLCGAKDDEECVALGVDLVAVMRIERSAQHAAVVREQLWVELSRTLEQLRRALDVGEEQGDGAARSVDHRGLNYRAERAKLEAPAVKVRAATGGLGFQAARRLFHGSCAMSCWP